MLFRSGSKAKAADAFYAMGGSVAPNASGLTGGMGLIQNLVESNPELLNLLANIRRQNMGNPKLAMGGPIAFAEGGQKGYLDGPGDGMSDSIPATIEGKQPARLADGEFVVPADVVSHLGNGSTKAGSKRLYAMLDKVRQARTGTKKQGKQIKPEKYMPA